MNKDIVEYNNKQNLNDEKICNELSQIIHQELDDAESKYGILIRFGF